MNRVNLIFFILIILASSNAIVSADGQMEIAKLPYDGLFLMHETISSKLPIDQPFRLHLFSSNPDVKTSDITLQLVSKTETLPIYLDECGYIDLPIRNDLVGQGAFIVSNQPKGTMVLRGEVCSQIPLQNRGIKYNNLISSVITANAVKEIAQNIPEVTSVKYLKTLHLSIDQEGNEPVVIRLRDKETITLNPDKFGNVLIPIEDYLIEQNPVVEFPSDNVFFTKPLE